MSAWAVGAWLDVAWVGTAWSSETGDTHDGVYDYDDIDDIRKRDAERNRKIVEAKRLLRQTIADLIEPRTEPAIILPPPELADNVSDADVERWLQEIEQWRELVQRKRLDAKAAMAALAREQAIEDDDEDIIMLASL